MTDKPLETRTASSVPGRQRLGFRTVLLSGFGILLLLMLIAAIDSWSMLRGVETQYTQIARELLYRERTLQQVRTGVYDSGDLLSDHSMIESDPERLRVEFESIQNQTNAALKACIQSLPPDKKYPFQQLAEELERYWSNADVILGLRGRDSKAPGSGLRNEHLLQYAQVLALTKEIGALYELQLTETHRKIAETSVQFRHRLLLLSVMSFGIAVILAAATIAYAARLEKDLQAKYRDSLQAQRELKELSKRLVEAEEQERRAISRELHDEVGQSLTALLIDVENLAGISSGEGAFRQGLQRIKTLAENCVNEVRNMALLLRPSMLDDLGLIAALDWQAREVSKRTGMLVDMKDENVPDNLPEEYKTCVYRVVQEALNNCSKHAYAKNVRVLVRQEPNHLRVSVEDDGKGFDASRVRGLGLVGMGERVSQLGGVLKVESDPTRGTCLRVDLPLSEASTVSRELTS